MIPSSKCATSGMTPLPTCKNYTFLASGGWTVTSSEVFWNFGFNYIPANATLYTIVPSGAGDFTALGVVIRKDADAPAEEGIVKVYAPDTVSSSSGTYTGWAFDNPVYVLLDTPLVIEANGRVQVSQQRTSGADGSEAVGEVFGYFTT